MPGDDPSDALLDAATAFEEGRHDDAGVSAAEVVALIDNADDVGRGRVMWTGGGVLLLGGVSVLVVVLKRRRGTKLGEVPEG